MSIPVYYDDSRMAVGKVIENNQNENYQTEEQID